MNQRAVGTLGADFVQVLRIARVCLFVVLVSPDLLIRIRPVVSVSPVSLDKDQAFFSEDDL